MSRLDTITKYELEVIVKKSNFFKDILSALGYGPNAGSMYSYLRSKLDKLGIDYSHIGIGVGAVKHGKRTNGIIPLSDILVADSSYTNRTSLKRRLISEGVLQYRCAICDNPGKHLNKDLTLQLDHVNGEATDNRLINLRFLCPNCHSQTVTYAGKNRKNNNVPKEYPSCLLTSKPKTKIQWPTIKELEKMLDDLPRTKVAAILGVSDTAVKKHMKLHSCGW